MFYCHHKKILWIIALTVLLSQVQVVYANKNNKHDTIFQVSTINALLKNVYQGDVTVADITKMGNTGLGTFNQLDGEMIVLNGKVLKVKGDGSVTLPPPNEKVPFAMVTNFQSDKRIYVCPKIKSLKELQDYLDDFIPEKNLFYGIKITGYFDYIKTRSVPKQEKPYPPITEVVRNQPVFEFKNIRGTFVGFRSPEYMEGITIPGYHLHFITEDQQAGGHLLDIQCEKVIVELDVSHDFYLHTPNTPEFLQTSFSKETTSDIQYVEHGTK